jgi:hypothetical protein
VLALCLKDTAGFYQRLGFAETPMNLAPKQMQVMAPASSPPSPLCYMHIACCLLSAGPRASRNQAGRTQFSPRRSDAIPPRPTTRRRWRPGLETCWWA